MSFLERPVRGWRARGGVLGAALAVAVASLALVPAAAQAVPLAKGPSIGWGGLLPIDTASGPGGGFADVSCASTRFCAAVDVEGNALTFSRTRWSRPVKVDSDVYGFSSVSCPRSNFCFAADVTGDGVRWNGKRWSVPQAFDTEGNNPSPSVSCTSSTFCAAADSDARVLVWRGKSWRHWVISDGSGDGLLFEGISCTSSTFCAAVDSAGELVTWNGTRWSRPHVVDSGDDLRAISCVSPTFCAAVGGAAVILRYRGRTWSAQANEISGAALISVSCATSSFCVTSDGVGDAYIWRPARGWLPTSQPSGSGFAVSCRTDEFCAAATGAGYGLFYAQRPTVITRSLPKANRGRHYSARLKAGGGIGPYTYSAASGLPHGLKLTRTGVVTGKPTKKGRFTIRVAVRDPLAERSSARVSLTVR